MNSIADQAFTDFQSRIRSSSLYKRDYVYYSIYSLSVIVGVICSFYFITLTDSLFLQILNALFLGFVFVQGGMLGHDLSHEQVFSAKKLNHFFASLVWSLIAGISASKWFVKHNAHHRFVNQIEKDPDLDMPFIFSQKQLTKKESFILRALRPYQHFIFFFVLPLVYLMMVSQAYRYILSNLSTRTILELFGMVVHFGVLVGTLIFFLPWHTTIIFLIVHFLFMGFYMSFVFAPNHKGQPILSEGETTTWRNQITCTRNVYPSLFIFHIFGGLNFQIEHHLFSDMARSNYSKVQPLVKDFCKKQGIQYHETTWLGSLLEIYASLKSQTLLLQR